MMYFAHSPNEVKGLPAQLYKDHVHGVNSRAQLFASEMLRYYRQSGSVDAFKSILKLASTWHDFGKLDPKSQIILEGKPCFYKMLNHVDAGISKILQKIDSESDDEVRDSLVIALVIVHGHHIGLLGSKDDGSLDLPIVCNRPNLLRDNRVLAAVYPEYADINNPRMTVAEYVDGMMSELLRRQLQSVDDCQVLGIPGTSEFKALDVRMMASCFVEGDFGDTGESGGSRQLEYMPFKLDADKRLSFLSAYVDSLKPSVKLTTGQEKRNKIRRNMFQEAMTVPTGHGFYNIDGYVGSGKTTANMALGLRIAMEQNKRRIFVVAPYNTIIDQTVDTYRECLIGSNEKHPEMIVAAHHHSDKYLLKATGQFSSFIKNLNTLWMSPIVVTTAVQFFETLGTNRPSRLRKLNQLAGSVIIIDESHLCLPKHLIKQGLSWLKILVEEYGCQVIFSSGSTIRYWEVRGIGGFPESDIGYVQDVACLSKAEMIALEDERVVYRFKDNREDLPETADWMMSLAGPRLIMCDTIANSNALTKYLAVKYGIKDLYQISTVLKSSDRKMLIAEINTRLKNGEDITIVGTSCIGCGVDFSKIRIGFCEATSLMAILQLSGRVNRNCEYSYPCEVWSFRFVIPKRGEENPYGLTENPANNTSKEILRKFFIRGTVNPEECTKAFVDEMYINGEQDGISDNGIFELEKVFDFQGVSRKFRVIDDNTCTVLIGRDILYRLMNGEIVKHEEIQENSVNMRQEMLEKALIAGMAESYEIDTLKQFMNEEMKLFDSFFHVWTGAYDERLLGYLQEM